MLILILFSFLGGIVTILSPCILPILPIVLSSSLTGGKRRPLGIVVGFILSFTFFTLFLSLLVRLLGLSADLLRLLAVIVVFGFGLSLLMPHFQVIVERLFSKLLPLAPKNAPQTGFGGGILIGLSLGLVWTPCVGPILASIITLAATSIITLSAVLITLAYAVGTAIPLLGITYGGRQLLQKVPGLLSNTQKIQKAFGVLMIVTALTIFFNIDRRFQSWILTRFPSYGVGLTRLEDNTLVRDSLEKLHSTPMPKENVGKPMFELQQTDLGPAPDFVLGGQWFNSKPLTLSGLRGKVVLVDFWTYTCINCIRTLPYLKNWHEKYSEQGLVIVGVHTPEFEFEKTAANVAQAIKDFDLPYPIMQDNDFATWNAYRNRYWPAKYLIDRDGRIRYTHFGEGEYDETESVIQELLAETGITVNQQINNPDYQIQSRTPELYLGTNRYQSGYTMLSGTWIRSEEFSQPSAQAVLTLNFNAKNVFLVMRPAQENQPGTIFVTLDDDSSTTRTFTIDADKIYQLVELPSPGSHTLKIEFEDGNIEVYAFTFG